VISRILTLLVLLPLWAAPAGEMNSTLLIGKSRLDIVVEKGQFDLSKEGLLDWIRSAAESVTTYYGHFPVPHALIRITPGEGRGIRHGMTFGRGGGLITIHVGAETTPDGFQSDWMLTHEMIHLAFPSMSEEHHWIEEGISTYVEPIARVRAKHMDVSEMWYELVRDLPQGLPAPGDKGLDHTHTWGRTYWGGALFCFLADLEIRRQTQNRKGLEDALRGILDAGADIRRDMSLDDALALGDHAVGGSVLKTVYDSMKDKPVDVDLPALWEKLGVKVIGKQVQFNDRAALAAARTAITYGTPQPAAGADAPVQSHTVFAGRTSSRRPSRNE
jgi:hypothetical protein